MPNKKVVPNYLLERDYLKLLMTSFHIYKTTNLINRKYYIGKHKGTEDDDYLGSGILLKQAIEKYGKTNFKKEILVRTSSEEELNFWEKKIINNRIKDPNCYNLALGGSGGNTIRHLTREQLEEHKQKISAGIIAFNKKNPNNLQERAKKQRNTLMKNIEKHSDVIRKALASRSVNETRLQHEKITSKKLAKGYYSIFKIYNSDGVCIGESVGAEKLAEKFKVSANGIRLAASHQNPIKRGNLKGCIVQKISYI